MAVGTPKITRFIAHALERGSLVMSQLETPIGPKSGFPHEFFATYLRFALNADGRRLARYRTPGGGKVAAAFARLRKDPAAFVEASCAIASHLESVVAESRYQDLIKPGDVMVAEFRMVDESGIPVVHDGDGEAPTYLAILKVKPSDAVLRHVEMEQGKRRVVFATDDRIPAPNEEQEIQKIAVLSDRRLTTPEEHDLVILDHNLKKTLVARFFHGDFLEASLNRDAEEDAERFVRRIRDGVAKRRQELDPPLTASEVVAIADRAETVLRVRERVSAKEVVAEAVPEFPDRDPGTLDIFRDELAESIGRHARPEESLEPSEIVRIDQDRVRQVAEKRIYLLDHGVKITGDSEALAELVEIANQPDPEGRTVLTIRTRTFQLR